MYICKIYNLITWVVKIWIPSFSGRRSSLWVKLTATEKLRHWHQSVSHSICILSILSGEIILWPTADPEMEYAFSQLESRKGTETLSKLSLSQERWKFSLIWVRLQMRYEYTCNDSMRSYQHFFRGKFCPLIRHLK